MLQIILIICSMAIILVSIFYSGYVAGFKSCVKYAKKIEDEITRRIM